MNRLKLLREHRIFVFIVVLFILLAGLYYLTVPLFEKPDEFKHFALAQHIQQTGQLPRVEAGVTTLWDQEGTQPPLYHILLAALILTLDLSDFDEPPRNPHYVDDRSFVWYERGNNNLYLHQPDELWSLEPTFVAGRIGRWLSVVLGVITLGLTYRLGLLFFRYYNGFYENASFCAALACGLIAFIPQFLHTSSAITNDSLSVTIAAGILLILMQVLIEGRTWRRVIFLGIWLGAAALTKLSLLYFAPLIALVWLWDGWREQAWARIIGDGLLVIGLVAVLAGWWYARNWWLYGDFSALNAHLLYRGGPLDPAPTFADIWRTELIGLELTFWAAFGAGQILWPSELYQIFYWLKYVVLVGLLIGTFRLRHQPTRWMPVAVLLLWGITIFLALMRWMQITPASWGRLMYPTLPSIGILSIWSLAQYRLRTDLKGFQNPWRLNLLVVLFIFSLALISPLQYINRTYGKPALLTEATLPANITRLDLSYEGGMRLLGYRIEQNEQNGPQAAGGWLPVTVYWQATQPLTSNYSTFVHALDPTNTAIAQSNSYPARGNWPTTMLPAGAVVSDRHYLNLPSVDEPKIIRFAMGMFEFEDSARAGKTARTPQGEEITPIFDAVPLYPLHSNEPFLSAEAVFGEQIALVNWHINGERLGEHMSVAPNQSLALDLHWQADASDIPDLTLFIHLLDDTDGQIAGFDAPPAFPTRFWKTGLPVHDRRIITLPADLPAGDYQLVIGWYHPDTFARLSLDEGQTVVLLTELIIP